MSEEHQPEWAPETVTWGRGMTRQEAGEAWLWCGDCNAKLCSFDGHKDMVTKCPRLARGERCGA